MGDILDHLRSFVVRPIAFRCRPAGRKSDQNERFTARTVHILRSPAHASDVQQLISLLGDYGGGFREVLAKHNGCLLYRDTLSDAAGVELFPVSVWQRATERLHAQIQDALDDPEDDPTGLLSSVVFAGVPRSGNYFVVQTQGPHAGEIFYTDHETSGGSTFAKDFCGFVRRVTTNPVQLLNRDLGCYTRYSDGVTPTQWIPEEVVGGNG